MTHIVQVMGEVQRKPFWLKDATGTQIFSWLHVPSGLLLNQVGVVIVGPVGPEYMHSHRSIRFLADELAKSGFAALRYDPAGMGNSDGDLADTNINAQWSASLTTTKDFFKQALGISKIAVITLRSGALVANDFLAAHELAGAVFWYPYIKGSAFVRDMQIIDSMLHMPEQNSAFIEGGGYPLYPALQSSLNAVDVLKCNPKSTQTALIINNGAQPPTNKLQQALTAAGVTAIQQNLFGLERMMKQSEITQVPEDNINAICEWFRHSFTTQQENSVHECVIDQTYSTDYFREVACVVDSSRAMFGVLTEPASPDNLVSKLPEGKVTKKPLVVFVNGGSGHHVGPNRLYVDICRKLAAQGFSSMRMDLSNLGDSAGGISPESHNPYALTATGDIQAALECLRKTNGNDEFILVGLCSGAHNSFQAALHMQSAMIREIILINPLAFHWKQGDSLLAPEDSQHEADAVHYQGNIRSLSKWVSLFTDVQKLRGAFAFALRLIRKKTAQLSKFLSSRLGVARLTRLEQDIVKITSADTRITLFIGETEPGYRLLLAQAGHTVKRLGDDQFHIATITNGDHTFSSFASRQSLVQLFVKQMDRYNI